MFYAYRDYENEMEKKRALVFSTGILSEVNKQHLKSEEDPK